MNRDYNYRKAKRFAKGIRRVKLDRAQHGDNHSCDCFCDDVTRGKGAVFARFADTPVVCSNPWCCGNPKEEKAKYKNYPKE